jgi:hypothetical protein
MAPENVRKAFRRQQATKKFSPATSFINLPHIRYFGLMVA